MGTFDSLKSTFNRGVQAANRTGKQAQLKLKQADLNGQRKDLMAQLGAQLYERVAADADLRAEFSQIVADTEELDRQRKEVADELACLEKEAASPDAVEVPAVCPNCGAELSPDDRFCSSCGAPVGKPAPADAGADAAAGGAQPSEDAQTTGQA